ncbi:hypothetical protein AB3S75_015444 [Citrus x aurantiifolia]
MEKIYQLRLACLVVLLFVASSGLSKACVEDADCADQCEFGKGRCDSEGHCECPGGKFAEKFAPGHHSKKQE